MVDFFCQCTNFSSHTSQCIPLQHIQTHTNAQHVNKTSSSSNPNKEGFFSMLQSNSWLGLGGSWGLKYNCRHVGYWQACKVGRSRRETTVMLSTADSETARDRVFHQWGLTHPQPGVVCSQAKYMVRRVSWWIWTALAKACWSRPLLWPDVWLPSALKREHWRITLGFSWTLH